MSQDGNLGVGRIAGLESQRRHGVNCSSCVMTALTIFFSEPDAARMNSPTEDPNPIHLPQSVAC